MGKIRDGLKRTGRNFFKPYEWMSGDTITQHAKEIRSLAKSLFARSDEVFNEETFEEAKLRYNLSEKDLAIRAKNFKRLAIFFFVLAVGVFLYGLYHTFWLFNFLAGIACFGIACGLLGFFIKYHFWYFQIKQRKLGFTLKEWFEYGILGKSKHKRLEKNE